MKNNQYSNKAEEALNSMEGIERATPSPFLFTRVMASVQKTKETVWEKAGSFLSRPSLAIAGLSVLIVLNVIVITVNHSKENNLSLQRNADYFSSNEIAIDNITNTTP